MSGLEFIVLWLFIGFIGCLGHVAADKFRWWEATGEFELTVEEIFELFFYSIFGILGLVATIADEGPYLYKRFFVQYIGKFMTFKLIHYKRPKNDEPRD